MIQQVPFIDGGETCLCKLNCKLINFAYFYKCVYYYL